MKYLKKLVCIVLAAALTIGGLALGKTDVFASMADEAINIKIGDTLRNTTGTNKHTFYYCFTLESKQRIEIKGEVKKENLYNYWDHRDYIAVYDANGTEINEWDIKNSDYYNQVKETYTVNMPLTLSKGVYYISVSFYKDNVDFDFTTEYAPSTKYPSVMLTATLKVGDTLQLGAIISPDDAKKGLKWSSTKKSVATVSKKGKVTAKKAGSTTIKATCNGTTVKIKITVKKK